MTDKRLGKKEEEEEEERYLSLAYEVILLYTSTFFT